MKKNCLLLFFFLLVFFGCKKEEKLPDTADSQKVEEPVVKESSLKVKASSLYLRKEPRLDSEKLAILPSGTTLGVTKTDKTDTYKDKLANWFFSKDLEGYVFGAYLVEETAKIKKISMDLYHAGTTISSCNQKSKQQNKKKLELFNDSVIYKETIAPEFKKTILSKGKYSILKNGRMKIELQSSIPVTLSLKYLSPVNGYLEEEYVELIKTGGFSPDKESCMLIKDDCDNAKDPKLYKIAYYCPNKK
jgi:hypothetical protein